MDWLIDNWGWISAVVLPVVWGLVERFAGKKARVAAEGIAQEIEKFGRTPEGEAAVKAVKRAIKTGTVDRGIGGTVHALVQKAVERLPEEPVSTAKPAGKV